MSGFFDTRGELVLSLPHTVETCPTKMPAFRAQQNTLTEGLLFYETLSCKEILSGGAKGPVKPMNVSFEQLRGESGGATGYRVRTVVVDALLEKAEKCLLSADDVSPELAEIVADEPGPLGPSAARDCPCKHLTVSAGPGAAPSQRTRVRIIGPTVVRAGMFYRFRLQAPFGPRYFKEKVRWQVAEAALIGPPLRAAPRRRLLVRDLGLLLRCESKCLFGGLGVLLER